MPPLVLPYARQYFARGGVGESPLGQLLAGVAPSTRCIRERSALYSAASAALQARCPQPGVAPRFFQAAARVTCLLGVGWADLLAAEPWGRGVGWLTAPLLRALDCPVMAPAGPGLELLRDLNAALFRFNAPFLGRLYQSPWSLFDPLSGSGPALPEELSAELRFDLRMVLREQLEVERWLRDYGLAEGGAVDRALVHWQRALGAVAAHPLARVAATRQVRHLARVGALLGAAEGELSGARQVRFSSFGWRVAVGAAHVWALHLPVKAPAWRNRYLACLRPMLQALRLPACRALAGMPAAGAGWR